MSHLYSTDKCNLCYTKLELLEIFQCPSEHKFCLNCFNKLKRNYCGDITDGSASICNFCKYSGRFRQFKFNKQPLQKLKPLFKSPFTACEQNFNSPATDNLITLYEKSESINGNRSNDKRDRNNSNCSNISGKPLKCLHNNCNKSISVTFLETHFLYDHLDVPSLTIERDSILKLNFDVSKIEYNLTTCLAMIKLYEMDKIKINDESNYSPSLLNVYRKFSRKILVNTFWLMMSGSNKSEHSSYVIYWLYSNCTDFYNCTLELSADQISMSASFPVVALHEFNDTNEITKSLKCLYIRRNAFLPLLATNEELSLNIIIH